MKWPKPVAGQVIRYSYLWNEEAKSGREEGVKDRPCAIIIAVDTGEDRELVVVVPITHTPPRKTKSAIEIPHETKRRLGLDDERSWIVVDESNAFRWPGPDLRPKTSGTLDSIVLGMLPPGVFRQVLEKFIALETANRSSRVRRTE